LSPFIYFEAADSKLNQFNNMNHKDSLNDSTSKMQVGSPFARALRVVTLGIALVGTLACQAATNTIFFTYTNRAALLADGWNFQAITNALTQVQGQAYFGGAPQNTENLDTNVGAVIQYACTNNSLGIVTRIPCDTGYL